MTPGPGDRIRVAYDLVEAEWRQLRKDDIFEEQGDRIDALESVKNALHALMTPDQIHAMEQDRKAKEGLFKLLAGAPPRAKPGPKPRSKSEGGRAG